MATTLTNSFEGVTPSGTTVTNANSGGSSGTAFDVVQAPPAGGTLASDSTHAAHGSLGCKTATAGTAGSTYVSWTTSLNTGALTVWWRLYLYFTANPGANVRVKALVSSGNLVCGCLINTSGQVVTNFATGGTTATTSTATIPLNQWFRLEGKDVVSTTVGQTEVKLFSSMDSTSPTETDTSAASQNNGSSFSALRYGSTTSLASVTAFWMDDVGYSDTAYLGPAATPSTELAFLSQYTGFF